MNLLRLCLPLAVVLATPLSHALAQEPPVKVKAAEAVKQDPVAATFAVVQIGEHLKVVKSTEVQSTRTELEKAHAKELKKFEDAKKAAEAAKTPFSQKAPVAQAMTVLKDQFKGMDEANAYVKQVMTERQAAKEKAEKLKETAHKKGEAVQEKKKNDK
jgi:hypothetical protein